MKIKKVLPIVLGVLGVILVATIILTTMFSGQDENVICRGVSIQGVDVGGMTLEEADKAIAAYITKMQSKSIVIKIDDEIVTTTFGELGYSLNAEESLEAAFDIGKEGNFLNRYTIQKETEEQGVDLSMDFVLEEEILEGFLEKECAKFDIEPQNAGITRENGTFIVTEHKMGRKVSVEDTTELIKAYLTTTDVTEETIQVEAVVADVKPEYTAEQVSLCKDVLGEFSTSYTTSSTARAANVANGASLINGAVVWPGETFSAGEAMNPITADNGYYMAGAYSNGQVIDSIGGGVCQVSTTLYNAVLFSELEVVERSNHSMIVGYVQPSMDAAIAGTYKDLKFKNNTDAPIYIEAITSGRTLTFKIYGHETRPANRTIQFSSEVLQTIEPGAEKITNDPTKPEGYRKVTQSAHRGYKAQLWKIVYENGVEVSREKVNYSSYAAEPAYVTVGTMKVQEEVPKEDTNDTENEKDDNKDENKDNATTSKPQEGSDSVTGEQPNGTDQKEETKPEKDDESGAGSTETETDEDTIVG